MRIHSFIAAGLGVAFALFASAGLKISAAPTVAASTILAVSAGDAGLQSTNRMLKADRLPVRPATGDRSAVGVTNDIAVSPELLDGCEPIISSIVDSPLARIAGSCVS